jgi:hypothetical protein
MDHPPGVSRPHSCSCVAVCEATRSSVAATTEVMGRLGIGQVKLKRAIRHRAACDDGIGIVISQAEASKPYTLSCPRPPLSDRGSPLALDCQETGRHTSLFGCG